jgi:hypothetical protein
MGVYFILPLAFTLLPFFVRATIYGIIPRRSLDGRSSSGTEQLISFDGDLDYIKKLALQRANNPNAPSSSPSSDAALPSLIPGESDAFDSLRCRDAAIEHLEILTFTYSIETSPKANITVVLGEIQEIILEEIAPFALACRNNTNAFSGIVAMDSVIPADSPSRDGKFRFSSSDICINER